MTPATISGPVPLARLSPAEILEHVAPFAGTPAERLHELARAATRRRALRRGEVVRQNAAPDGLYVLLHGRVNLTHRLDERRALIVASLGPGALFGETCVCPGASASTSAVCATPSELLLLPAPALVGFLVQEPHAMFRLMRVQVERLRDVETVAGRLALCDVGERLVHTLAHLAARQGRHSPAAGGWVLVPAPTRAELARMIGTCRETVSRGLGQLHRRGLLCAAGRRWVLAEPLLAGHSDGPAIHPATIDRYSPPPGQGVGPPP
jgi:CRP-like cAMP-binding protein